MANDDASDREQQHRELEEIRRKFTEMGDRMGSLFEPAPGDDEDQDEDGWSTPALPAPDHAEPSTRPPSWQVAASVGLVFLLGAGFGYLLPRSGAGAQPATSPPSASALTAPQISTVTRTVVPRACLEAARRGDKAIHLLTINVRDRRLAEALRAYTRASQACREEASP